MNQPMCATDPSVNLLGETEGVPERDGRNPTPQPAPVPVRFQVGTYLGFRRERAAHAHPRAWFWPTIRLGPRINRRKIARAWTCRTLLNPSAEGFTNTRHEQKMQLRIGESLVSPTSALRLTSTARRGNCSQNYKCWSPTIIG
jgi:hypothetical protein